MRALGIVIVLVGCGRVGFDRAMPCSSDTECATAHCAGLVCCDTPCTGSCNQCTTGTCLPVATDCSGDCATCAPSADGFSCTADPEPCTARCPSATCVGSGTAFACDLSSCCATDAAPNFTGTCGTAATTLVPDGCRVEYDYNSCCTMAGYLEYVWDVEQCTGGSWVQVDSGADASPCPACTPGIHNIWSDTCGNPSAAMIACP